VHPRADESTPQFGPQSPQQSSPSPRSCLVPVNALIKGRKIAAQRQRSVVHKQRRQSAEFLVRRTTIRPRVPLARRGAVHEARTAGVFAQGGDRGLPSVLGGGAALTLRERAEGVKRAGNRPAGARPFRMRTTQY
jgi:hypothetical protein